MSEIAPSRSTTERPTIEWRNEPDNWRVISALLDQELSAARPDPAALNLLCAQVVDYASRRWEGARQRVEAAVDRLPENAELRIRLAQIHLLVRDFDAASIQIDAALRLSPQLAAARLARFTLLQQTEQWPARDAMVEEIARIDPMNSIVAFARLSGEASVAQAQAQLAACDAALADNPAMTDATYYRAIALERLGRRREAAETASLDRFVEVFDLPSDDDEPEELFRTGLAQELMRNPSLTDRHDRPGRNMLYAPDLNRGKASYATRLKARLTAAVDGFVRRHAHADAPFMAHRPRSARLSYWATVSTGTDKVLPHRHTAGWLSGVYYVASPQAPEEAADAGALLLGVVDARFGMGDPPWGVRTIKPIPGRLVLFPSYISHATAPTNASAKRISVAFDVVPSA